MSSRYSGSQEFRRREQTNAMLMGFGSGGYPDTYASTSSSSIGSSSTTKKTKLREPEAVERLRGKLTSKGVHGLNSMVRLLRIMDDNGDGVLTKDELKYGLEDLGVKLNRAELDELFEYFDKDNSGAITQDEFIRGIRGPLSKDRANLIKLAFDKLDKTHDNCVTMEDLELAYDASQHPDVVLGKATPAQALREFLRQWDNLEDESEVSYGEFLEYHKNVSASIESDKVFTMIMDGIWHLGLDLSDPAVAQEEENSGLSSRNVVEPQLTPDFEPSKMYTSTSKMAQIHPDAPRSSRAKVPNWLRYHGESFCFSLFYKQKHHEHTGSFDPRTRTYKEKETFSVRTFVLKYFLEDQTVSILETTAGRPQTPFMSRGKLPGVELQDLIIGNLVRIKGIDMTVSDADKKARAFFKEQFPKIRMPSRALSVPEEPNSQTSKNQEESSPRKAGVATKKTNASLQFIENDGKILHFECVWDDPSLYGERRLFMLLYFLGDDTLELREISARNSGRERSALLNLKRQRLPNPNNPDLAPYKALDLKLGSTLVAFGREMKIMACDAFTREFFKRNGVEGYDEEGPSTKGIDMNRLNLYSNANDQKFEQIVKAIKLTTEQRARFGTEFDQRRLLTSYLGRFKEREDGALSRAGFRSAMSGFSCFGADADLLFERLGADEERNLAIQVFVDAIYPPAVAPEMSMPAPAAPNTGVTISRTPRQQGYTSKVRGLVEAIQKKLEVMTNFGETRQQRMHLSKILKKSCVSPDSITRSQFRGAMAKLNCWEGDAFAIFDAIDTDNKGVLSCAEVVDAIVAK